ncbi:protein SAAL1 isoform X2 [Rhodamnia argentea]|uniref:Protein SAAL1 isoform X2 n=1 Tax=Rhodamnia argentea TaxID=178133 RepID=A0A8B8NJ71_9MYRT|nr:protein SAAL1 isoform X2 [Rhodamnia argentea]
MAVDLESALQDEEEEEEEEHALDEDAPAHHPVAPPDESFELSTTVDPSYIISLIRKLLPPYQTYNSCSSGVEGNNSQKSNLDLIEEKLAPPDSTRVQGSAKEPSEIMDIIDDNKESACEEGKVDGESGCRNELPTASVVEEVWEGNGCILWDLAASQTHAELMVENLVLDVLLANPTVPQSARVREICLGIIGNLACHEVLMRHIVSTKGLVDAIVDQLFLDDTQCLCEACRFLTLAIQGNESNIWAEALLSDHVIRRLLWIAENTLNPLLIEKCVGLLLTISESQLVAPILLPPLVDIGLPNILFELLAYEMSQLTSEKSPERYPVLDVILRAIEALSVMDDHSHKISSNKELIGLVCDLVKLPDKMEIADSCVTAAVLMANIMSDVTNLATEMSQDLPFLQGLLGILPFAANDIEARNALWSIIVQLLVHIKESETGFSSLYQYVSVLASKCDMIEEDLLDHQTDSFIKHGSTDGCETKSNVIMALERMASLLHQWKTLKDNADENSLSGKHHVDGSLVDKLLHCCERYINCLFMVC